MEFLRTPEGQASIPQFSEELHKAQRYHNQNDATSDTEDDASVHHEEQEDWMVLCQLHQDLSNQPNDVDWAEYSRTLQPATVRGCKMDQDNQTIST